MVSKENQDAINKLKRTKKGEMVKVVLLKGSEVVGCVLRVTLESAQLQTPLFRNKKGMTNGGRPVTIFLSQISDVLPG